MVEVDTSEKYIKTYEAAKDIQRQKSYENGDFVFDPFDGGARSWFWYHSKDVGEFIRPPRHDQLQEIRINFYMQNLSVSRHEAFFYFV